MDYVYIVTNYYLKDYEVVVDEMFAYEDCDEAQNMFEALIREFMDENPLPEDEVHEYMCVEESGLFQRFREGYIEGTICTIKLQKIYVV